MDFGSRCCDGTHRLHRHGSTTYNEPYNLARLFASVDHLSGGRAGWNIVTTGDASAASNFGFDRHPTHADRTSAPASSLTW
ncbi:LLM class flavin-dependent oxidoreductase [Mesorhizobium sp.]|uniref:LLM class flavin-dependent oxidoreductase n=1 Tax=Mesorhizobium sp. TaxID=1871066 RepID=UPI0025807BA2|nr:LLM class flavin-dependent oxidoreductase [Mesorhizobium sp.]